MAVTLEELQIKFTAQMGNLTSQLNGVKSQLGSVSTSAVKTSNAFAGLARMAKYFIGAFVVRGMINVGKESLKMANDVVESEQLFAVSMKGMAGEARKWSDGLRDSLGLNAYSLRKNVGMFNTMFRSMGLGTQKAYDMATGLIELSEDMASFYNMSSDDMFVKLQAGISGEIEPLRRLGIILNETTTKNYALRTGIITQNQTMTESQKVMARYGLLLELTADAQGDLARTIDSPVNRLRILSAQFDQAKIAFGQAIQPLQAAVIPVLTALARAATVAAQALAYLMGSLSGFGGIGIFANKVAGAGAAVNNELADSLGDSAKAYKKAGGAAKQASKDAAVGLKAFDEINKLTEETTKTGGGAGIDEIDVPDIEPANAYADTMQVISEKVKQAVDAIKEFWESMKSSALGMMVEGAFSAVQWVWNDVIKPFGEWALKNPNAIGNVLGGIGAAIITWNIGRMLSGAGAIGKIGAAIAAHPVLATMAGIAAGLAITFGAINSIYNEAKTADLAARFGEISLTMGELEYLAGQTRSPFVNLITGIKDDYTEMAIEVGKINRLVRAAGNLTFGFALQPGGLQEGQMEEIAASAEGLVTEIMSALEDRKVFSMGNIPLMFGTDSAEGKRLLEIDAASWAAIEEEAEKLHLELDSLIAKGFSDGMTPELAAAIVAKQQQIADLAVSVLDVDSAMAKVRMHGIFTQAKGATLDADTVKNLNEVLDKELETQLSDINMGLDYELSQRLVRLNFQYESGGITKSEYNALEAETLGHFDGLRSLKLREATLSVESMRYTSVIGQITAAYKDILDKSKPAVDLMNKDYMTEVIDLMLNSGWTQAEIDSSDGQDYLATLVGAMMRKATEGAQLPEDETKQTMRDWIDLLAPNYAEWKTLEAEYKRLGIAVPTTLAQGIADYEAMLAVAGNAGQMKNAVLAGFGGVSLDVEGSTIAKNFAQGFIDGVNDKLAAVSAASKKLADAARSSLTRTLVMNSPSKVTEQIGQYFGEGFAIGIGDTGSMIANSASSLANIATKSLTPGNIKSASMDVQSQNIVQQAVEAVLDRLQITLNVDGETWGRASVKHINNAQRMSGRVLLEM